MSEKKLLEFSARAIRDVAGIEAYIIADNLSAAKKVPACFSQGEMLQELEQNVAEVYHLLREDSDLPVPPSVMTKAFPIAA